MVASPLSRLVPPTPAHIPPLPSRPASPSPAGEVEKGMSLGLFIFPDELQNHLGTVPKSFH